MGSPVAKERQCFTDNIPGYIERRADGSGLFAELLGLFMVDIVLVEAGVKERCVTEQTDWERH
jgi:hypothetical protein